MAHSMLDGRVEFLSQVIFELDKLNSNIRVAYRSPDGLERILVNITLSKSYLFLLLDADKLELGCQGRIITM